MAIPTITNISPNSGPPCGYNLVVITGTNFRVPTLTYTIPATAVPQTVSVTFDGVAARRVDVASTTKLYVIVPQSVGDYKELKTDAINVVVTNLDDDGVAIPTETVTATAAYRYKRWPLEENVLAILAKEFIKRLRREVVQQVSYRTHPEFGEEDGGTYTIINEAPSISLDIDFPEDKEFSHYDNGHETIQSGDDYRQYRALSTYRMDITMLVTGRNSMEAMHLVDTVKKTFQMNPFLTIPTDSTLYPGYTDSYPVDIMEGARKISAPNNHGICVFSRQASCRGIQTMSQYATEWYKSVDDGSAHIFISDDEGNNIEDFNP